jgi:predicted nucleic acid-binding protein
MNLLVLDTNILLHLVRGKQTALTINDYLQQQEDIQTIISVVSIAEAESVVKQVGNWGNEKIKKLHQLFQQLTIVDIEAGNSDLLESYVNIDAFSQGKIPAPNGQMLNNSSRNMGKNDLWIAATAHALNAVLLTTDNDFDHLNNIFFEVKKF